MIIAIKMDGVISTPLLKKNPQAEDVKKCKLIPDAVKNIKKYYKEGHRILIYTSRSGYLRKSTEEWLNRKKVPYSELRMGQIVYDVLISSNVCKFYNWEHIEKNLVIPETKDGV